MSPVSICPICKAAIPAEAAAPRPFCSRRCRIIDLGSWLEGSYRISQPGEEADDESAVGAKADDEPS